jgi:hypothetical protein
MKYLRDAPISLTFLSMVALLLAITYDKGIFLSIVVIVSVVMLSIGAFRDVYKAKENSKDPR